MQNMNEMMNREQLFNYINCVSFAVNDVILYLDTHPNDKEAAMYFNEYSKMRNQALKDYAKLYGPLTIDTAADCDSYWQWIEHPWPWEGGKC